MHSLSVTPKPLAIWNKELEGLESGLFKELKTSPVAALEHIYGFFYSKRTRIQGLGIFSGSKNILGSVRVLAYQLPSSAGLSIFLAFLFTAGMLRRSFSHFAFWFGC